MRLLARHGRSVEWLTLVNCPSLSPAGLVASLSFCPSLLALDLFDTARGAPAFAPRAVASALLGSPEGVVDPASPVLQSACALLSARAPAGGAPAARACVAVAALVDHGVGATPAHVVFLSIVPPVLFQSSHPKSAGLAARSRGAVASALSAARAQLGALATARAAAALISSLAADAARELRSGRALAPPPGEPSPEDVRAELHRLLARPAVASNAPAVASIASALALPSTLERVAAASTLKTITSPRQSWADARTRASALATLLATHGGAHACCAAPLADAVADAAAALRTSGQAAAALAFGVDGVEGTEEDLHGSASCSAMGLPPPGDAFSPHDAIRCAAALCGCLAAHGPAMASCDGGCERRSADDKPPPRPPCGACAAPVASCLAALARLCAARFDTREVDVRRVVLEHGGAVSALSACRAAPRHTPVAVSAVRVLECLCESAHPGGVRDNEAVLQCSAPFCASAARAVLAVLAAHDGASEPRRAYAAALHGYGVHLRALALRHTPPRSRSSCSLKARKS